MGTQARTWEPTVMVAALSQTMTSWRHGSSGGGAGVPRRNTTMSSREETVALTLSRMGCLIASSSTWTSGTDSEEKLLSSTARSWWVLAILFSQRRLQKPNQSGTYTSSAPQRGMLCLISWARKAWEQASIIPSRSMSWVLTKKR